MVVPVLSLVKSLFVWNAEEKELVNQDPDSNLIRRFTSYLELPLGGKPTKVRIVIVKNDLVEKLDTKLPLIFLIHGLGGQVSQWYKVLDQFAFFANVVAIDLPGHGKSDFVPEWNRVNTSNLIDMMKALLLDQDHLLPDHQGVIVVGHSMGGTMALKLAIALGEECVGVAALAPAILNPKDFARIHKLQGWAPWVPPPLFDVFRAQQRLGGINSQSVKSFMSPSTTDQAILRRQLRTNLQVNTPAWLRMVAGFQPLLPEEAAFIKCPVIVISAQDDKITPVKTAKELTAWLQEGRSNKDTVQYVNIHKAAHGLLIERPDVLVGLMSDFIAAHVDKKLSLPWQLAYRANLSDKWSLKNEKKWRETLPVGTKVKGAPFRGLKTLRQEDLEHSPQILEEKYPDIVAVIDISREHPPYEPDTFTRIKYYKFPTVSKVPPSRDEVENFIKLVDSIPLEEGQTIGVHCHYGFNRTGFLITSYMIEKRKSSVADALAAFQESRPTGIHHPHFIDELEVRYEL